MTSLFSMVACGVCFMWVQWSPIKFLWHPVGEGMVAPVHGCLSVWLVYMGSNIDGLIRKSLG